MKASGAILAGGKSSRMKFNKAFAQIDQQMSIEIIIHKFKSIFSETIIISNEPELFQGFNLPVFTDVYPRLGPVSGIHAALYYANYEPVFILGCDMPFLSTQLIENMISRIDNYHSVVPSIDGFLQATAAVYSKTSLPIFEGCLKTQKLKLTRILKEELNSLVLNEDNMRPFGEISDMFFNLNDNETLEQARKIAGRLRQSGLIVRPNISE
ncbi:MAG: molybdenum cofactor guanylyltransferase [Syntrophomonadaceae bacterium]|mgnify:CR=1 FL=1|nr:molybdenum cofactor guanylyltransferase [Syntrophomonadaceae bacterium]